jgi:diaminopimelate epimerase
MRSLRFTKMHGLGNDFIVVQGDDLKLTRERARAWCDRQRGVGADQILHLKPTRQADVRMEVWNSDGSTSSMCGNGLRAVALFLHRRGFSPPILRVETASGVTLVERAGEESYRVNMGPPLGVQVPRELAFLDQKQTFIAVDMGNPHAVFFTSHALDGIPLETWGSAVEMHNDFSPARTNAEWVAILSPAHLKVRVWERGSGATLACGSGACAVAVAAISEGIAESPLQVELPGGALKIEWGGRPTDPVFMTGPVSEVFVGELRL